jgi:hypothetical protein
VAFDQEQGLDVEDMHVRELERMKRLFLLVLVSAQFVFFLIDQWPQPTVQRLRSLGGKLPLKKDLAWFGLDQLGHCLRGGPAGISITQQQREEQRHSARLPMRLDPIHVEVGDAVEHAQRHPAVHRRVELDEHVDVEFLVAPRQFPALGGVG